MSIMAKVFWERHNTTENIFYWAILLTCGRPDAYTVQTMPNRNTSASVNPATIQGTPRAAR
jgi:hypothetical protein